jgi:hypothetical protein
VTIKYEVILRPEFVCRAERYICALGIVVELSDCFAPKTMKQSVKIVLFNRFRTASAHLLDGTDVGAMMKSSGILTYVRVRAISA